MLAVTVELLLGTFRGDPSGLAHTGSLQQAEWPPSPLRLFAALVAADGTRDRTRVTTGEELGFLESLPPPAIYASAAPALHHQPLEPRYVVQQTGGANRGTHQEYVGRFGQMVRPGARVSPRDPRVVYVWDVEAPPSVFEGLRRRAARVGYLGTADSPVAVRVEDEVPSDLPGPAHTPDEAGTLLLGVPQPGIIDALDAHFDRWLAEGPAVHRSQSVGLRRLARYRDPSVPTTERAPEAPTIWLRFEQPVSGRRVTVLVSTLKAALLDHYQRIIGEPPVVLHGHHQNDDPAEHALFLALPDAGHRHASGRLHGAAIAFPAGTEPSVLDGCREAIRDLARVGLVAPGLRVALQPWGGEERPVAANPRRWLGRPARRFATVIPALHERRGVSLTLGELARWCRHAGLPAPVAARSGRSPFIRGGIDLRPTEVNRPGKEPRPYSHLELIFEETLDGFVVIGAGRHRGLGLCAPVPEATS